MIKLFNRLSYEELLNSPDYFSLSLDSLQRRLTTKERWVGDVRKVPPMSLVKAWAQSLIKDRFKFECEHRHTKNGDFLFVKAPKREKCRVERTLNDYAFLCQVFEIFKDY